MIHFFKVGFLVGICLPCYEMLKELLPHTADLLDGARYTSNLIKPVVNSVSSHVTAFPIYLSALLLETSSMSHHRTAYV